METNKQRFVSAVMNMNECELKQVDEGRCKYIAGLYLETLPTRLEMMAIFDGIVEGDDNGDDEYLFSLIRSTLVNDTDRHNEEIGEVIIRRITNFLSYNVKDAVGELRQGVKS